MAYRDQSLVLGWCAFLAWNVVLLHGLAALQGPVPDPKYNNPYVLQIRNGPGQVIGQGAVKLVKAEVSLGLLLPEFDARRLSLTVLDYIRAWKQAYFADLARARVRVATGKGAGERGQDFRPAEVPAGNGRSAWGLMASGPWWRRDGPRRPAGEPSSRGLGLAVLLQTAGRARACHHLAGSFHGVGRAIGSVTGAGAGGSRKTEP